MTNGWRIDALDARGGLCFASRRPADLGDMESDLDWPAVHIAPPFFRPEPIEGRAGGFSASRARFQLGLFSESEEVAFPTLASLAEFVRRAYVSSGGGDGANGVTPPGPPPEGPSGEPPSGERESGERKTAPAIEKLLGAAEAMEVVFAASGSATATAPGVLHFAETFAASRTARADRDALTEAAAEIVAQLLWRAPDPRRSDQWAGWLEAAARAGLIIGATVSWPRLLATPGAGRLTSKAMDILERLGWSRGYAPEHIEDEIVLRALFGQFGAFAAYWRWGDYFPFRVTPSLIPLRVDPIDDLLWIALPAYLKTPDVKSLWDLLCAVVGSPDLLRRVARPAEAAAFVLLAAAHVSRVRAATTAPPFGPPKDAALDAVIADAMAWLGGQFPKFAYAPQLEKMIGKARELRS